MLDTTAESLENFQYNNFEADCYLIYHQEFARLLGKEIFDLCAMCKQLLLTQQKKQGEHLREDSGKSFGKDTGDVALNSGGVYRFIMECTRCEDLLDQVHADQQSDWAYIRKLTAMIKHSCSITAHLQYLAVFAEQLTNSVEGNFIMANQFVLRYFYNILLESASNFLQEVQRLEIIAGESELPLVFAKYFTPDVSPLIRLSTSFSAKGNTANNENTAEKIEQNQENILYLVSTLLQDCNIVGYLGHLLSAKTSRRNELVKNELHEETLVAQGEMFHSMITFFDTQYVQRKIVADREVFQLINYVKVIYHLFTGFGTVMRIEERHRLYFVQHHIPCAFNYEATQGIIFDFFVQYIDRFRVQIEKICKLLVQKYSVPKQISLPIPCYRGFHVRPSTLIARIVMHYGSTVTMKLQDTAYNASVPLDLFRANEVINAEKRRQIGAIVAENKKCKEYSKQLRKNADPMLMKQYFGDLFLNLQQQGKIVVYELLSAEGLEMPSPGEDFLEYVKREVAYLMATGKIDITSELSVLFEGDSRVLTDIAILAENGYGEDKAGNNVPLPKELSYLSR